MQKRLVSAVCLGLVVFLTPSTSAQNKGDLYTVIVPAGSLVHEGGDITQANRIYGVDTQRQGWELTTSHALPRVLKMRFEKRNKKKTEIEFRIPGTWVKLRFRNHADMTQRLNQYAVPESDSWGKDSEEAESRLNEVLDGAAAGAFKETTVPTEFWRPLAKYAMSLGGIALLPSTSFRGGEYLTVQLGDSSVFNTLRINQSQRVARVVGELMSRIKDAGSLSDVGLVGVELKVEILYRDFSKRSNAGSDFMDWYIESAAIPALRDFEITSQDFVNQSVVIVNGTRVEVDLSDQG